MWRPHPAPSSLPENRKPRTQNSGHRNSEHEAVKAQGSQIINTGPASGPVRHPRLLSGPPSSQQSYHRECMPRQADALCQVRFNQLEAGQDTLSPVTKRVTGSLLYKKQYYDCAFAIPSDVRPGWPLSLEISLLTPGVRLAVGEPIRLFRGTTLLAEGKIEKVLR